VSSEPLISWQDIGRTYAGPEPVIALRETDLTLRVGERMAVVGPSGSGKSTLLNILGLLDAPTSGTYRLMGVDVTTLRERERSAARASMIGFVFQAFHLIPTRTVRENVELGLLYQYMKKVDRVERSARAVEQVGLGQRMNAMVPTLSGGERQRVAVARALASNPRLLLCDEPTGNLDSAMTQALLRLLDDACGDHTTLVIVTHDAEVAASCRRRLELRDGWCREVPSEWQREHRGQSDPMVALEP
jgi:putative ABC transport system ATP-binding protein